MSGFKDMVVNIYPTRIEEVFEMERFGKLLYYDSKLLEKLRDTGVKTLEQIAVSTPLELELLLDISGSRAESLVSKAKTVLRKIYREKYGLNIKVGDYHNIFPTSYKIYRISTGFSNLDELLGGGIESSAITEFIGSKSGVLTKICLPLMIFGSSKGYVAVLDTNDYFKQEDVVSVARKFGFESNIYNIKILKTNDVYTTMYLILILHNVLKDTSSLVVIHSLTEGLTKCVKQGNMDYADAVQKLNKCVYYLFRCAEIHNLAVVITNYIGKSGKPYFNSLLSCSSSCRIRLLVKSKKWIARVLESRGRTEVVETILEGD